jgi:hypothetical protein
MAFFTNTDGMDSSNKLPWFPSNFNGRVRIDMCKGIASERSGRAFIVETTVLTSNLSELAPSDPSYVALGSRRSWYQGLKETGTSYPACIGFLYAALGLAPQRDQAKIDKDIKPNQDKWLNSIISDQNPLNGAEVMLQTTTIKTKAGDPFTLHNWSPVDAVKQ